MKIYPPNKVYVARSPIHGWGVFANEIIFEDEIIEETPLYDLKIEKGTNTPLMMDYRFNWPQGTDSDWDKQVLPWGYGSLYNHSETPNAFWRSNLERETFEFVAIKKIQIGEEIFVYYGGANYWEDGRISIKII